MKKKKKNFSLSLKNSFIQINYHIRKLALKNTIVKVLHALTQWTSLIRMIPSIPYKIKREHIMYIFALTHEWGDRTAYILRNVKGMREIFARNPYI